MAEIEAEETMSAPAQIDWQNDAGFAQLPLNEKHKALLQIDSGYKALPPQEQQKALNTIHYGAKGTAFEQENAHQPYYGFTPSHMGSEAARGVKELAGGMYGMGKDILFPEGNTESEKLGGLAKKYIFDPADAERAKARNSPTGSESIGHSIASALPLVGPWAASLGEQGGHDPGGALARGSAQVGAAKLAETTAKPIVEAAKNKLPAVKSAVGLATRTEKGTLKPQVKAASRFAGAAIGHGTGIPGMGEVGGFIMGPSLADAILPDRPVDVPTQPLGARLPASEDFYQHHGEDLTRRGKEQAALDRQSKVKPPPPEPFPGATATSEPIGSAILPKANPDAPQPSAPVVRSKAELAPKKPQIVAPGAETGPQIEGEGRPATWSNERVLELAAKGNRAAIAQAGVRQLPLPPNARYVMGDVDYRNLVTSPREVTKFSPEGQPIRQEVSEPIGPNIDRIARAHQEGPPRPQPESPLGSLPLNFEQNIPVPSERPIPPEPPPLEKESDLEMARRGAPEPIQPEEAAEPAAIKGVTEPIGEKIRPKPREKVVPIDQRFGPEEIADAEGLLAQESGAMLSADRPGAYYDENAPGEYNPQRERSASKGVTSGGNWRGVKSGRDMFPLMREHPEWGPEAVQKALRNKDSAAYRKMMEAATEFIQRGKQMEEDERSAIQEEPPEEETPFDVLPGMGEHVRAQEAGAAKLRAQGLFGEMNSPRDISQQAGEMETKSPLFRGTAASPQNEMFSPEAIGSPIAETALEHRIRGPKGVNPTERSMRRKAEKRRKTGE